MSARMALYAIFAPLRPSAIDLGAGCLACGVCLRDCAGTITASFDMIAATTGVVPGGYNAGHPRRWITCLAGGSPP